MRKSLVLVLMCGGMCAGKTTVNLAGVAAATTVAVNAGTMLKWIRHPKAQSKATVKAVKETMKPHKETAK